MSLENGLAQAVAAMLPPRPEDIRATLTLTIHGNRPEFQHIHAVQAGEHLIYWLTNENKGFRRDECENSPGAIANIPAIFDEVLAYQNKKEN